MQNSCILFAEAARLRLSAANGTEIDKRTADRIVLETFERGYMENPENLSVGYALGTILMKYGQFKQAGEKFADVFQRNETNYRALTRLVLCFAELNDKTSAMRYLEAQNKPGSQLIELHYKTALLYCNRAAFMNALKTSRKEDLKDFDAAWTFTTLNETLQNMGLIDRAYACWNLLGDMVNAASQRTE